MRRGLGLVMLLMLPAALESNSGAPPGKPVLVDCRSPEKETFTCRWEPGSDGGLPTVNRLFYERDGLEGIHECPDYRSAGENTCYFNKSYTSIWVEYSLRVVASNALGNASSDPLHVDVMKIVKPDSPVNITVLVNNSSISPYLHVSWKSPPTVDTKSGWATLSYELRYKQQNIKDWKTLTEIRENFIILYSVDPGTTYEVQARCQLDRGTWSEWSVTALAKIPKYFQNENEKPTWIMICVLALIPLLATVCILVLKRKIVKQCLLPPVPGPKIKGVDVQLLKSGRSKDVVSALIANQNFPSITTWLDQTEEFLIVADSSNWLLADPYISKKNNKNLIIPADLHIDSEIQCGESTPGQGDCEKAEDRKDETGHLEKNSKSQSKENLLNMEPLQLPPPSPSVNFAIKEAASEQKAASENSLQPDAATGYVDVQQHEKTGEADATQWDYSRVKEVNGDTVLILKNENASVNPNVHTQEGNVEENVPANYSRVREVDSDNVVFLQKHDTAESLCKKKGNHNTECTNQKPKMPRATDSSKGMCLEVFGNGYVDSVPKFSAE